MSSNSAASVYEGTFASRSSAMPRLSAVRTSTCSGSAITVASGMKKPKELTWKAQRHRENGEEKTDGIAKSFALMKSPPSHALLRGAQFLLQALGFVVAYQSIDKHA